MDSTDVNVTFYDLIKEVLKYKLSGVSQNNIKVLFFFSKYRENYNV